MIGHGCDKGVSVILTLVCIYNTVVEKRPCRSLYHLYSEPKECPQNLTFPTSQNLRTAEVRRNLRKFSIQPPLLSVGSRRAGSLGPCPVWFQISPRMESPEQVWTSVWATVMVKPPRFFLCSNFQFFNLCLLPLILSVRRVWLHLWRHEKSLSSQRIIQLHLCLLWQNIKVQCFVSVSYYFPESLSKACSCPERHFSDRHVCTIAFYCGLPRSAV